MRKFLLMAAAVVTMAFAACSGDKKTSDADALGETLKEQIEKKDQAGIMQTVSTIKDKIMGLATPENLEMLKTELPKYQQMLNDNKEQILSVVGNNETVASIINTVAGLDASSAIDAVASQLGGLPAATADAAEEAAESAVEEAKDAAADALEGTKDKAADALEGAKDAAAAAVQGAQDKAAAAVQGAQDAAAATVKGAQDKAAEAVQGAKDKANDVIQDAANKLKF